MSKRAEADESVLSDLPELIETFQAVVAELQTAETCEEQKDLRANLLAARDMLRLAARDLDSVIERVAPKKSNG